MKNPLTYIRQSLSLRLSLWILLFAVVIFVVSLGFLFQRARTYVKQEAVQRATQVLNNTALRVQVILTEIETATNNTDWLIRAHLHPDSIYTYSRQIIELNPNLYGCSIAFVPYFFQEQGEYFSVYSKSENGVIETEQEGGSDYRYFDKDWYRIPRERGEACWVDPFYDKNTADSAYVPEMITSYSKPLADSSGRFFGVISSDLSLKWLSQTISAEKPYPHSYCIMLGKEGRFFVHPDTAKLVHRTIFTDANSKSNADVILLGHAMLSGEEGMSQVRIDGKNCYVFYRPLAGTDWSIAIVCPESDIFERYNSLFYIVLPIIFIGLLLMLVLCRHTVNSAIVPLNQLARQSRHIAEGNFSERMPRSKRIDAVGKLQNMFGDMQQSIDRHVSDIKRVNAEIEQRNAELVKANELAKEADEKKTAFMQDITHQVRTPLNIITGFSQVLLDGYEFVSEEEMDTITDAMQENSKNITTIVDMLVTASNLEMQTEIEREDLIVCNEFCREMVDAIKLKCPETVELKIDTSVPDSLQFKSNKEILTKVLKELLGNANKFTQEGSITLGCQQQDAATLCFVVTDTGIGIPEEDKERIFEQFTKLNYYSEGLGLGLTLCKRIAQMLGGNLELDAAYHTGARFILTLPLGK